MSRLTPLQGLLMNLNREIEEGRREYLSLEQAYEKLKELTGQDFGYDVEKWRKWLKRNPNLAAHREKKRQTEFLHQQSRGVRRRRRSSKRSAS